MSDAPKPINVSSAGDEEIGRRMSNFAAAPFTLDGRRYASVEGFYVGLKFADAASRVRAAALAGREAYEFGKSSALTETEYGGRRFALGSAEHHVLIARAIRAKLAAHPDLARAFAATHPRPIVHVTAQPERPGTFMPASTLCRILTEIRDELVAKGVTSSPPVRRRPPACGR
ncbi:MAG: NADAR family protein [Rhodospirillales bacterium]